MKKRYLILEDGTIFQGWAFGADQAAIGELVFNTSVVGYVETLTDASYYGQIIMQTFPMVGNYGIMEEDFNDQPRCAGYVVKEYCKIPSNFRCEYDLDTFLKKNHIPGLYGVDTRELTNRLREYGVVNAMLTDKLPDDFDGISAFTIVNAVETVGSKAQAVWPAVGEERGHVALVDFGAKMAAIKSLTGRGWKVTSVPADTTAEEILAVGAQGVVLSPGPGDPAANSQAIETVKALLGRIPMFGIGLGHQILALAAGGKCTKLKYGHRGSNQPCNRIGTRRTYITTQNHGYAVVSGSVACGVECFVNVNDKTNEGMEYPQWKALSVQFDPESCTVGAKNSNELFEQFAEMMKEG